jgi:hypothetical protein
MEKWFLAGISLAAVMLLAFGSQTSVVGYQTVKASQQHLLQATIDQQEVLLKKVKDFSQKITAMRNQNVSLHYIIIYLIGFLYGLITWIPAAIIISIEYLVLFVVLGIVQTMIGINFSWEDFFIMLVSYAIYGILIYPFLCGYHFVERFP